MGISLLKVCVNIGFLQRPALYAKYGVVYGIVGEILYLFICLKCYGYMIYCMRFLPKHKTTPEMKLTYAKVSQYILDESDARKESMK